MLLGHDQHRSARANFHSNNGWKQSRIQSRVVKPLKTTRANRQRIMQVTETSSVTDEGLGHVESDVTPALAGDESSTCNVERVVGCFIHVALPPLADLPRSSDVSGVVFTDEGGTLLGHTVFPGSVTEATPWPYVGIGNATPYSSETNGLRGLDIALEVKSIVGRLRRLSTGFNLLVLGLVGLGALFQLGYPIA